MLTLKLVWSYAQKYWWILLAVAGFVIYRLIFKQESGDIAKTLADIQKRHEEELRAIRESDEKRRLAYEENAKKLQHRLDEIERQYVEAQQQLDKKKRAELEKILQESKDDPDELAKRLSDAAGFKVIVP